MTPKDIVDTARFGRIGKSKRVILEHAIALHRSGMPLAHAVDVALKTAGYRKTVAVIPADLDRVPNSH